MYEHNLKLHIMGMFLRSNIYDQKTTGFGRVPNQSVW